jgi:hypothetical protein
VQQVYEQVLLPAMERAVSGSFGVLATPVLWIYRRTIGTAVRSLVRRVVRQQSADAGEQRLIEEAGRTVQSVAQSADSIQAFTDRAGTILTHTATRIRRFAILPLQVALVMALVTAAVPLLLICYFFGG